MAQKHRLKIDTASKLAIRHRGKHEHGGPESVKPLTPPEVVFLPVLFLRLCSEGVRT